MDKKKIIDKKKIYHRNQKILKIALPSIVTNITVPLLGLVDVAIVGHLGHAAYIGAIAVGSMIFNLLYWVFAFLRMGTSGLTSQAYGRRDLTTVVSMLLRSLTIALSVALVLLVIQVPFRLGTMYLMSPTADVRPFADAYFNICIWGAPAEMAIYALTGWFIGMQNTKIPMVVSILQNVVNIAASTFLVFVLGMKVEGVATGTVIAQYAGVLTGLWLLWRHYGRLRRYIVWQSVFLRTEMVRFFQVNRDIFLRTLCLVAVNLYFTSAGARQGAVILAANTVLMQFFLLYSYIMDGFANAGEALSGRYFGARNAKAFFETEHRLFKWGLAMALGFTVAYVFGGGYFVRLLTNETAVLHAIHTYLWWTWIIPLLGMAAFIWDGIYIGITATRGMLISLFISAVVFFTVCLTGIPHWGNHALWLAMNAYILSRGIVQTILRPKRL